jgi:predicted nucleic acid-binding protein
MKLALDTNAYAALHDGNPALVRYLDRADAAGLPVVVVGELYYGFLNGSRFAENEAALNAFLATEQVKILHISEATARLYGEVAAQLRRNGTPIPQNDVWIAALCKEHGYTLATRDRGFFNVLGLPVIDYSQE